MKINKNAYIYSVIVVTIVGVLIFWMSQNDKAENVTDIPVLLSPSPTLELTPTKGSPKPTPTLIVKEVNNYQSLVDWLEPINRHLVLDENCTSIVPSQVAYPNNTQIMLDNTFSAKPRILKIGSRQYSLAANGWLLVTLSSTKLPAQLTMFCGSMELGQLDLE